MKRKEAATINYYKVSLLWSVSDHQAFNARWRAAYRAAVSDRQTFDARWSSVHRATRYMSPIGACSIWGEPSTWTKDVYQRWLRAATT